MGCNIEIQGGGERIALGSGFQTVLGVVRMLVLCGCIHTDPRGQQELSAEGVSYKLELWLLRLVASSH